MRLSSLDIGWEGVAFLGRSASVSGWTQEEQAVCCAFPLPLFGSRHTLFFWSQWPDWRSTRPPSVAIRWRSAPKPGM